MLRIMLRVAAGEGNFSRLRAWVCVTVLALSTAFPGALAWADPLGTISVDGPSARLTLTLTDPITCTAAAGVAETWPPLCVAITSDADASGTTPYAFSGTLAYDPERAYYDADEDLVHAYYGTLTWSGAQSLTAPGASTASIELTATKEGHQSGVLVVVLNGIDDIPVGTRLSVALVGDAR